MIQSMTGYGKSVGEFADKKITVEIKSVNSKNLNLNTRLPASYRPGEVDFRSLIKTELQRGKVDCNINIEGENKEAAVKLNEAAIKKYVQAFKEMGLTGIGSDNDAKLLEIAMKQPDSTEAETTEVDKSEFETATAVLRQALDSLNDFRSSEGQALQDDFAQRIANIDDLLQRVIKLDPEREKELRGRLQTAVSDLKESVDEERFEQELIFYLEKYDITEEKIRLAKHLEYFQETMETADSNGKKLNFISQEIGREINTIGSKANDVPIQKCVVQMKDELEKIKEQILNVL